MLYNITTSRLPNCFISRSWFRYVSCLDKYSNRFQICFLWKAPYIPCDVLWTLNSIISYLIRYTYESSRLLPNCISSPDVLSNSWRTFSPAKSHLWCSIPLSTAVSSQGRPRFPRSAKSRVQFIMAVVRTTTNHSPYALKRKFYHLKQLLRGIVH